MGADDMLTLRHRDLIADLRSKLSEAQAKVSKFSKLIQDLEEVYGDASIWPPAPQAPDATATTEKTTAGVIPVEEAPINISYAGLGLGDACVKVMTDNLRPMTNREILDELKKFGVVIKSDNPLNNVGSSLNHRAKSKGDIVRLGKHWHLKSGKDEKIKVAEKIEGPAMNGAYQPNGATAATA